MLRKAAFLMLRIVLRSKLGVAFFKFMQNKWRCIDNIPPEQAREALEKIHSKPNSQMTWALNRTYSRGLSVVIPFYKTEKYARRCIESVLSQKCDVPLEIILIDDGSPDRCGEILDSYSSLNKQIRVVHQDNKGHSGARNAGIELASHEYIMFLDSDDLLCPNAIHALISLAYKKGADIVEGGFQTFGGLKPSRTFAHNYAEGTRGAGMSGYPWGKVIKTSLFRNICFPTNYWYEDTIVSAILYPKASLTITIPDVVVKYFNNPQGITRQSKAKPKCIDTLYLIEDIVDFYHQTGNVLDCRMKKGLLHQLGGYLYYRTERLKSTKQAIVFLSACELAGKCQLLDLEHSLTYHEKELQSALIRKQYTRWVLASISQ